MFYTSVVTFGSVGFIFAYDYKDDVSAKLKDCYVSIRNYDLFEHKGICEANLKKYGTIDKLL